MAAIRHHSSSSFRARRRRTLPWLVAGLGALGARTASGQSSVDMVNLIYDESNSRIHVMEQMLLLHQDLGEAAGLLDVNVSHDSISGASPTGAYPSMDVTTSASGSKTTGQFPLARESNYRDALALAYGMKLGAHLPTVDVSYSKEDDYVAREAGLSDSWTMAEGRGVLHYGLSETSDLSEPITNHLHLSKKGLSYAVGWTWILGPDDLVDVSMSRTRLHGYLDEPYKVVTVGATTAPDHRPGTRTRDALLFKYAHYLPWEAAVRSSYRFYTDDWGIRAHTLDLVYEQHLNEDWTFAPEVRYYTQSKASFYGDLYQAPQTFMSSDYRLSAFSSVLGGLSLTYRLRDGLLLKAGGTMEMAKGRNPVTPLAVGSLPGPRAVFSGPPVSSADLDKITLTVGLSWRY